MTNIEYIIDQTVVYNVETPNISMANFNELYSLSNQISIGHLGIISHHILPRIPHVITIRIRELRILEYIYAANDEVTGREIAESTGYDTATVSRAISRLVKLGMVEKNASLRDKRTRILKLSATGKKLAKSFAETELKVHECLINRADLNITTVEYAQFLRIAKKLLNRIATIEYACSVLDNQFCRDCLQSQENPPHDPVKAMTECWPCNKYSDWKKSFVTRKI